LCSIVGNLPVGFCCSKCYLYDENHTCLNSNTNLKSISAGNLEEDFEPISTSIEDGMIKVVIKQNEKEIPLLIDIKKQLQS
ncbi:MAG: hypothetical protein ACTSUT_02625, partial [Promethearchaeota archaeon]